MERAAALGAGVGADERYASEYEPPPISAPCQASGPPPPPGPGCPARRCRRPSAITAAPAASGAPAPGAPPPGATGGLVADERREAARDDERGDALDGARDAVARRVVDAHLRDAVGHPRLLELLNELLRVLAPVAVKEDVGLRLLARWWKQRRDVGVGGWGGCWLDVTVGELKVGDETRQKTNGVGVGREFVDRGAVQGVGRAG